MSPKFFLKPILSIILPLFLVVFCFTPLFAHAADDCGGLLPMFCMSDQNPDIPHPEGDTSEQILDNLIRGLIGNLREIIAALAIAFLVISGFLMVTAQGNEDVITTQKRNILWAVIGLSLLSMGENIIEIFKFNEETGVFRNFFTDPQTMQDRIYKFDVQVDIILTFLRYIIGSIAVLFIVRSASKMIVAGYKEDVTTEEKKTIWAILIGLMVIVTADFTIRNVLYKIRPYAQVSQTGEDIRVNVQDGIDQIVGITNFIVMFAGPLAVLMLIVGGILYATSAGDDEKMNRAKKLIVNTLLGVIIIYFAYALVATFISGVF